MMIMTGPRLSSSLFKQRVVTLWGTGNNKKRWRRAH